MSLVYNVPMALGQDEVAISPTSANLIE
jgi:hypothetical protein